MKIPAEAPEGSVRFRRVPVQIPCEVPEGSGADALCNSKGIRCFYGIGTSSLWHKRLIFMA